MNKNRGIFDDFPNQPIDPKDSPFAIASDAEDKAAAHPFTAVGSPFSAVTKQDSPFSVADGNRDQVKSQAATDHQSVDSPFQVAKEVAEPSEGFGFEAPAKTTGASPFAPVPAASVAATSPFVAVDPSNAASSSTQAAMTSFDGWQQPAATEVVEKPASSPLVTPAPAAPDRSEPAAENWDDPDSDSYSIRQLELRAIFGVDREMTTEEILQRSRALPGIRNIARLSPQEMDAVESIKKLLLNLGFGDGALKLHLGSVPLDFIREGKELLAVQTDGSFAPGVRETLILVARELDRSA